MRKILKLLEGRKVLVSLGIVVNGTSKMCFYAEVHTNLSATPYRSNEEYTQFLFYLDMISNSDAVPQFLTIATIHIKRVYRRILCNRCHGNPELNM